MNHNYIILNLLIFPYIILLYHIILHYIISDLTFILVLLYDLFKGNNGKVKLERSRQLDTFIRKACE